RKSLGCDPDQCERMPVDADRLIENRLAAQVVHPVAVADHGDGVAAALTIVLRKDRAADQRLDAEHRKVLAGDDGDSAGMSLLSEGDIRAEVTKRGQPGNSWIVLKSAEDLVAEDVVHAASVVRGTTAALEVAGRSDEHQFFGTLHGQGAKDHLVQQ